MNGRALLAVVAALIAVPLTLTGALAVLLSAGAATCTTPAADHTPPPPAFSASPLASPLAFPPAGPAGSAGSAVADAAFDDEQVANARIIVTIAATLGVPVRGWIIAVATAIQESSLRNIEHGDTAGPDSLGLFQQRDPWGPRAARLDPAAATRMFYLGGATHQKGLLAVHGWQSMPLTDAAQAVQNSAHPDAYADREAAATQLVFAVTGSPGDGGELAATSCEESSGPAADRAVAFARQQIGVPYRWGGNGPTDGGFDCSGLTTAAYAAASVKLPRTAQTQYNAGPLLDPGTPLQPGDLVFFGTNPRHVTHVGLYIGGNQMINAPHRRADVRIDDYRWDTYLGASRPSPPG